ncbi:tetratricopeptide repeat protein [uncultured Tateyamaria sp.]|uniref:tetratricopeptide repeat protein n=1 Tax=uncultured Tateyamaria sp. TaxID=455651 RepID=UPI00260975A0|nr:tetratricopeptide repeat protein [uncultured Tateyamaria sp.]
MDYPLFSKCFDLFYLEEDEDGRSFRSKVGSVFSSDDFVSGKQLGSDKTELFLAFRGIDGFTPRPDTKNLKTIVKNLCNADHPEKAQSDKENATALAFICTEDPRYYRLKPLIEEGLPGMDTIEHILEKYRTAALIALGRYQPNLVETPIDFPYEHQILHYACDAEDSIKVLGRDKQQNQLRDFLKDERTFLWLQLAGVAGQGKSRLAFELIQEAKKVFGYDAGYLRAEDLEEFKDGWSYWQPDQPKLIVVDYVQEQGANLGPSMAIVAQRSTNLAHRVRFLLLERQPWNSGAIQDYAPHLNTQISDGRSGATEADFRFSEGFASWFSGLEANISDRAKSEPRYRNLPAIILRKPEHKFGGDSLIDLKALSKPDLRKLVNQVAAQQSEGNKLSLSDPEIDKALIRFDNSGRPLYAYFLGIALAHGRFEASWDRTDLLDSMLTIYRDRRWSKQFKHAAPELHEARPGLLLAVAATVLRALKLAGLHSWPFDAVSGDPDFDEALTLVGAPRGNGAGSFGKFIPGLLPDLLGEWFVLQVLTQQPAQLVPLICWCWETRPQETANFLLRIAQDFPTDPTTQEILDVPCSTERKASFVCLSQQAAGIVSALIDKVETCPEPVAKALQAACDDENADALATRAFCHWKGFYFERSDEQAFAFWERAAQKQHARSLRNLGVCYQQGIGIKTPNAREAMQLYQEAVEAGNTQAKVNLAFNLEQGIGVDAPDLEEAMRLYREAAEAGNAQAKVNLAFNLQEGIGVDAPDLEEAMRLFREAAEAGNAQAKVNLAFNLEQGIGVDAPDLEEAMRLYREAAEAGKALARELLAAYRFLGRIPKDYAVSGVVPEIALDFRRSVPHLPPDIGVSWDPVSETDAAEVLNLILDAVLFEDAFKMLSKHVLVSCLCADVSFYEGCRLLDLAFVDAETEEMRFLSALLRDDKALLLDGTSLRIRAINRRLIDLGDDNKQEAYLRFSCEFIRGEDGSFHIITSVDALDWAEDISEEQRAELSKRIGPIMKIGTSDDETSTSWMAAVNSGDIIYRAYFLVHASGMIKMTDVEPIADELPIRSPKYQGAFRFHSE